MNILEIGLCLLFFASISTIPVLIDEINDCTFAVVAQQQSINGDIVRIGDYAFINTNIAEFDFGEVLEVIGDSAFESTKLTSIYLPEILVRVVECILM